MNVEALKRSFEKRASRVMSHADKFGKAVSGQVGEHLVSAPNKMNPFWRETKPVGFIQIAIQRLDNQPINPEEITDLTSRIDSEATNYGSTLKSVWLPNAVAGNVDHTIYHEWIGFEVKTTATHRQFVKRFRYQKMVPNLQGRIAHFDRRLSPVNLPKTTTR